jgi:cytochrome b561
MKRHATQTLFTFGRIVPAISLVFYSLLFTPPALARETGSATPEGLLPHFESLIALGIVLTAVVIAWLLNHRAPKARAGGTFVGALSCLAMIIWFALIIQTGVLETPKPHQAPMDAAKPALLWIQMIVISIVGLGLLLVAYKQSQSSEELVLSSVNEVDRYGRTSRVLHWTTAILFIFMIPTGIFASMIPEDAWFRTEYNVVHKTIGFIILGLFVARMVWNRTSKRPGLDTSLKPVERKLAHGAHIGLYVLMLAVPVTGYVMTSLHGYPSFFFVLKLEPFLPESDTYILWGLLHKYLLQYLVYIILGAHILGALKHHFVDKHKEAFKRIVG